MKLQLLVFRLFTFYLTIVNYFRANRNLKNISHTQETIILPQKILVCNLGHNLLPRCNMAVSKKTQSFCNCWMLESAHLHHDPKSASQKTHCSNLQGCWIKSFPKEWLFYFAGHSHHAKNQCYFVSPCLAWK